MAGRSSIERLPPAILAGVDEAIVGGATIDEIVRLIRAQGATRSRSAVARYVKGRRARLLAWREEKGLADFWLKSLGGEPEGATGRQALAAVRSLAMRAAGALGGEKEPPAVDQIATLALALQRIEGAGKSGAERESAAARGGTRLPGWPRSAAEQKKGLSQDAVDHLRAAVQGRMGIGTSHAREVGDEQPERHAPETGRLGPR